MRLITWQTVFQAASGVALFPSSFCTFCILHLSASQHPTPVKSWVSSGMSQMRVPASSNIPQRVFCTAFPWRCYLQKLDDISEQNSCRAWKWRDKHHYNGRLEQCRWRWIISKHFWTIWTEKGQSERSNAHRFYERNDLVITSTWFTKPKTRLYTWKPPGDWIQH
jgi:hypothetical protein